MPVAEVIEVLLDCFCGIYCEGFIETSVGAENLQVEIKYQHRFAHGFDDVLGAAYHYPSLTTIRQPLHEMGRIAAESLLKGLGTNAQDVPEFIEVDPELVVRESTGPAPASHGMRRSP